MQTDENIIIIDQSNDTCVEELNDICAVDYWNSQPVPSTSKVPTSHQLHTYNINCDVSTSLPNNKATLYRSHGDDHNNSIPIPSSKNVVTSQFNTKQGEQVICFIYRYFKGIL